MQARYDDKRPGYAMRHVSWFYVTCTYRNARHPKLRGEPEPLADWCAALPAGLASGS